MTAEADYWLRRARDFDEAMPRPGDHRGGAVDWETGAALTSGADQTAIAARLRAAADDCRSRAEELAADRDDIA